MSSAWLSKTQTAQPPSQQSVGSGASGSTGRGSWMGASARKAGRPVREAEWIIPEADFPSRDDNPPLKVLLLRV